MFPHQLRIFPEFRSLHFYSESSKNRKISAKYFQKQVRFFFLSQIKIKFTEMETTAFHSSINDRPRIF